MDFEWDMVQRQDLTLGLTEPGSDRVRHEFRHLPGVLTVEPTRTAFVRISYGHHRRQLGIQGLPANGRHSRVLGAGTREIPLPPEGLVVSSKLAEVLGVAAGQEVLVEVLEGRRPRRLVPVAALAEDFAGMAAYMEIHALNRLLGEGDAVSGASFRVDPARRAEFLRALKDVPRVSWVAIKDSLRENFRKTTAASIGLIQKIYMTFATIVAFGVVYNNARISLAERARELATLRVIGFSQREVASVLITELLILAIIAVPIGLVIGTGFATGIIQAVNTETVRLPLVITSANYTLAVLVVTVASILSGLAVLRRLRQLDLVSALKAPE
jgi:putative ABC transport system permease protein